MVTVQELIEKNHFLTAADLIRLINRPTIKSHHDLGWVDVSQFGFIPQSKERFKLVFPPVKKLDISIEVKK